MRRFPSEPLNLVDHLHGGVLFLRAIPERSLNYFTALSALIPQAVSVEEVGPTRMVAFPHFARPETDAEYEARMLAAPLNRYEQAHCNQILQRRGFLPDGTPTVVDPDYSIIHHDVGYSGPRGDVA